MVQVSGLFYDVIQPHQVPPPGVTCEKWENLNATFNQYWRNGSPPAQAENHCAQQALGSSQNPCVQASLDHGSICPHSYCIDAATMNQVECQSVDGVPEQINVQIASPDTVVVGWVTHESPAPVNPPTVSFSERPRHLHPEVVQGVTHTCTSRKANASTTCTTCP